MNDFDDIDTPVDESILSGSAEDDHEALAAIAADEADADEGGDDKVGDDDSKAEAAAAEAEAPPVESRKDDQTVPRARLNEVTAAKRAAEERAEALEAELNELRQQASTRQAPVTPEKGAVDLDQKEREYLEATYTGDTDAALAIRREIQAEERRIAIAEARAQTQADLEHRETSDRLQKVAEKAVADHPFLNDNDGKNKAMDDLLERREFYVWKGFDPATALEKAVSEVAPIYAKAPPPTEAKPDSRKEAAAQRAERVAGAQPPAMEAGIGNRAAPPIPRVDSQEDWERLPQAERERMLG